MSRIRSYCTPFVVGALSAMFLALGLAAKTPDDRNRSSNVDPRAVASAQDLSAAFRGAADEVLPAVVAIETRPDTTALRAQPPGKQTPGPFGKQNPLGKQNPFEGTPFEDMFRNMPDQGFRFEQPSQRPRAGLGSGVIIDPSGIVLTNNHVVGSAGTVTVRLHDGREFEAADVWTDPQTDIAVIKLEGATDLVAAELGDSDTVDIGEWVLALGQPFGLESTVTAGIISAKHRGIGITSRENFLQTDAAINPGNSGGPLVNLEGHVVGINTAISSRSGGNDGIGFAVPINLAEWVADQLVDGGVVHRAYLGVGIQPVTADLANQFQVQPREGVLVTEVLDDTPAQRAGVLSGDVIIALDGRSVSSPHELQVVVERARIGSNHKLTVIRDGREKTLTFKTAEQPVRVSQNSGRHGNPSTSELGQLGLEVAPLDEAVAKKLEMPGAEGVVVTSVTPHSRAARAGLKSGMVISELNRQPVRDVEDVQRVLGDDSSADILALVRTANGSRFVVIES